MSIPKHVTALANHKGAAIVHAGGMLIPVKIMDISHEETLNSSETAFKCLVVNPNDISTVELTRAAKTAANSIYGRQGEFPSDRYSYSDVELTRAASNAKSEAKRFEIDRVIFNDPATIVFWKDGTKTVVKCQEGDTYSPETGLAIAFTKNALGNKGNFNDVFKKYIPNY